MKRSLLSVPVLLCLLAGGSACSVKEAQTCTGTATINLKSSVAELRSSVALPIEVVVGDSGNSTDPHPVKVVLTKDGAPVKTLVDEVKPLGKISVDFVPSSEKDLSTGAYEVKATVGCPASASNATPGEGKAALFVARLGVTKIVVGDGEGGGRVPLMYHAVNHASSNYYPIPDGSASSSLDVPSGEPDLDTKDGVARTFPAPWDDLETPPVDGSGAVLESGNTLPVSLKVGTKPDITLSVGKMAAKAGATQPSGLASAGIPAIRVVIDGTPGNDAPVSEGGDVTIRLATSPVPAVDRVDFPLKWHFEVKGSDGAFASIPGSDGSATLRFYGVLGNEQGTAPPNLPWVAVVDEATKAVGGKAKDDVGVRAALVQHIYEDSGLSYDRKSGASKYTSYGSGWTTGTFSLTEYLKRSRGKIVNCSDCASILSTFSNMVGAKLHYAIIGWDFKLNAIMGIGSTTFGSPFDSGYYGFSYHAVTSHDATSTINDATLAVDGDSDPKTAPYTKLLVQNLTGADYLTRLSPTYGSGTPKYQYNDQLTKVR